jgi:hypothetical protein
MAGTSFPARGWPQEHRPGRFAIVTLICTASPCARSWRINGVAHRRVPCMAPPRDPATSLSWPTGPTQETPVNPFATLAAGAAILTASVAGALAQDVTWRFNNN